MSDPRGLDVLHVVLFICVVVLAFVSASLDKDAKKAEAAYTARVTELVKMVDDCEANRVR